MGRHKGFDEAHVMARVLELFWRRGYLATSMQDLQRATGLKPGSLYHSFGSKEDLFLCTVDYYLEQVVDARVSQYLSGPEPLAGIRAFFTSTFMPFARDFRSPGCLLTNTVVELGQETSAIRRKVQNGLRRIERALHRQLQRAQTQGRINRRADTRNLARHLLNSFQGLMVMSKLSNDKRKLTAITDSALQILEA